MSSVLLKFVGLVEEISFSPMDIYLPAMLFYTFALNILNLLTLHYRFITLSGIFHLTMVIRIDC